ncbi:MAG: hypothetical protein SOI44_03645 [Lactimicrobium sp.]|uniref:hypothetical protein n=1 Tax=Lactimicrobium sp. TaxID=2563780 RepID=UPI002F360D25
MKKDHVSRRLSAISMGLLLVLAGCSAKGTAASASPKASSSASDVSDKSDQSFLTDTTIEEQTIYDSNGIRITASSLEFDSSRAILTFNVENNADQEYSITTGSLGYSCNAINGWMVEDGWFNVTLQAGKKSVEKSYFDLDSLKAYGIHEIGTIQMGFDIEDSSSNDHTYTGPIEIKTSKSDSYQKDSDWSLKELLDNAAGIAGKSYTLEYSDDQKIFDENGVTVSQEALVTNQDNEQILMLLAENNGSDTAEFSSGYFTINNVETSSGIWSSDNIIPGKKYLSTINLSNMVSDEDEQNVIGFDHISTIDFQLSLMDGWDYVAGPDDVTLTVSDEQASADTSGDEVYNSNGITMISKGLTKDKYDNDERHWEILVQNNSGKDIMVTDQYDSLSIGDYMVDYIMFSQDISNGSSGILDIEILGNSLKDNNIDPNSITSAQITLEIKDSDYNDIDTPTISADFQ